MLSEPVKALFESNTNARHAGDADRLAKEHKPNGVHVLTDSHMAFRTNCANWTCIVRKHNMNLFRSSSTSMAGVSTMATNKIPCVAICI